MKDSNGLDFFAFSVDFFDDDKLALIESEFGIKGTYIAVRLLCRIYKFDGYFLQWGKDQCQMFCRTLGAIFVPNQVEEIVQGLVRRDFFDKAVYDSFHILTSRGIQYRWLEAARRRKTISMRKELCLVDTSSYSNLIIFDPSSAPLSFVPAPEGLKDCEAAPVPEKVANLDKETMEKYDIIAKFMFDKNFLSPCKEFNNLVNWNNLTAHPWKKMSHAQRMSAAEIWKQKDADGKLNSKVRFKECFLPVWKQVYEVIRKDAPEYLEDCLSDDISYTTGLVQDMYGPNRQDYSALRCSKRLAKYIGKDNWKLVFMDIFQPLLTNNVHLRFHFPKN